MAWLLWATRKPVKIYSYYVAEDNDETIDDKLTECWKTDDEDRDYAW